MAVFSLLLLALIGGVVAASVMADAPAASFPQQGGADLALRKGDSPDPVIVYEPLTYTLSIGNAGPVTATSVFVTDTLPFGVSSMVTYSATQGTCSEYAKIVTCTLGDLGPGAVATVTIGVTPISLGTLTNTAIVTATTGDPNPANNTATATTTVQNAADLSIAYHHRPNPVVPGMVVTYTMIFTNGGPGEATHPRITNTLPSGMSFGGVVSSTAPITPTFPGRLAGQDLRPASARTVTDVVLWEPSDLGENTTQKVVYTASVVHRVVTDTAEKAGVVIGSDRYDPDTADNAADDPIDIGNEMTSVTATRPCTITVVEEPGVTTTVQAPAGSVTESVTLLYTTRPAETPPAGWGYAGRAFALDAYRGGERLSGFAFQKGVTVTMTYTDADVAGLEEDSLVLDYRDGDTWQDAAGTCTPPSTYRREPDRNRLSVAVCHLSDFALFGRPKAAYKVYLPLVLRDR